MGFLSKLTGSGRSEKPPAGPAARRPATETQIAVLGPGAALSTFKSSPDSMRALWVSRSGDKSQVVVDGRPGLPFDQVSDTTFSPDSKRVAYFAGGLSEPRDMGDEIVQMAEMRVMVDGVPLPVPPFQRTGAIMFSPDSKRLASCGRMEEGWVVTTDDWRGKPYPNFAPECFLFSPDSSHLAYGGMRDGQWITVLDGEEQEFPGLLTNGLSFSPDSRRFAYQCKTSEGAHVVVDGVKQPVYDGLGGDIMFSPDSRHISYIGIRRNRHFVVIDGSENGPYDGTAGGTVFSRHGARVAYVASTNRKWMVLIDGQASSRHDDVTGLALSGEGRRMAYVARDGGKERFVLDGSPGDPWDRIYLPTGGTFSPDGSRWLYVARNGNKVRTVIDGEPGNPYDDIAPTIAWVEGERVAYLAEDREQKGFVCVLDGVESNVYDIIVVWGDLSSNLVPPQEGVVDQPLNYLRYLAIRRGAVLTVREEVTLAQAY